MLTVTQLDITDPTGVRDAYAVVTDVNAHDTPDEPRDDLSTFAAQLATDWEGERRVRYLAHLDAEPAGFAALALYTRENRDIAQVLALETRPAVRRRGVGRALFTALHSHARGDGRAALIGAAKVAIPGGPPQPAGGDQFALAMGGVEAMRRISSRLDLTDAALPARLAAALDTARGRSTGYSVATWCDRAPDEYAADLAALYSRILTDQPLGTLGLVAEHYDIDRFRAAEQSLIDHGCRNYCAAARHDETGQTVGLTEVAVRGPHGWQGTTIVDPQHRGHGLGLLIKAANTLQVRESEPALRHVTTGNNGENRYILDINETIGYRPHCVEIDYRVETAV